MKQTVGNKQTPKARTAAIYARFSNKDLQNPRSIDDQVVLCRDLAAREGLKIVATFADRGKSSATVFEREGLQQMMVAAKAREFDVLIVESLDRLSRDLADLPELYKRLTFFQVSILTANEAVATPIHVGLRAMYGSIFLKDLGDKVRRSHLGRAREGKFASGLPPYGYRCVPGKPCEREIDPERADIVRRIFREYVAGRSPGAIIADLTREGIPSPAGAGWRRDSLISGGYQNGPGRGMLGHPLYRGEIVWNTTRNVRDPETGRKVKRPTDPSEWVRTQVPHLAIVDVDLWEAANAVRDTRAAALNRVAGTVRSLPRKEFLLSGLLRCGTCGGGMHVVNGGRYRRVACAAARDFCSCGHTKSYDMERLESGVLAGLRQNLIDPEVMKEAARGFHAKWAEQERKARGDAAGARKRLARLEVQIGRLIAAIRDSEDVPVAALTAQLRPLETERVGLVERLRLIESQSNVVSLHPKAIDAYRVNVDRLHAAFTSEGLTPATRTAFRNLVDCVVVHPTERGAPYEFTPYGRLGALMGVDLFPPHRSPAQMLADEGVVAKGALSSDAGSWRPST